MIFHIKEKILKLCSLFFISVLLLGSCTVGNYTKPTTPSYNQKYNLDSPTIIIIKSIMDDRVLSYPHSHSSVGYIATGSSFAQPRNVPISIKNLLKQEALKINNIYIAISGNDNDSLIDNNPRARILFLDLIIYEAKSGWTANAWDFAVSANCQILFRLLDTDNKVLNEEIHETDISRGNVSGVSTDEQLEILSDSIKLTIQKFLFDDNTTNVISHLPISDTKITKPLIGSGHQDIMKSSNLNINDIPSKYNDFLNGVVIVRSSHSIGTGFFVTKDGYIITNNHVVGNDSAVSIKLRIGQIMLGNVLSTNRERDLALIKVEGDNFSWLSLGNLKDAGIGTDVLAVGTPQGFDWSVTKGIISAIRNFGEIIVIQTDTAINSGNSGGPLISLNNGAVIGVNTFGLRKDTTEGLNFAIASDEIKKAFPQYVK
jgi:S1-C subfamily serine protease